MKERKVEKKEIMTVRKNKKYKRRNSNNKSITL